MNGVSDGPSMLAGVHRTHIMCTARKPRRDSQAEEQSSPKELHWNSPGFPALKTRKHRKKARDTDKQVHVDMHARAHALENHEKKTE